MILPKRKKSLLEAKARAADAFSISSPIEEDREKYFRENYNTKLSPEAEGGFQKYLKKRSEEEGRDVSRDLDTYDMRGFFAGRHKTDKFKHGTDKFKKPNHSTFSDQSMYHGTSSPLGGKWEGGKWGKLGDEETFTPSRRMLQTTHPRDFLEREIERMNQREINRPKIRLLIK
jgi:hypothetical protein